MLGWVSNPSPVLSGMTESTMSTVPVRSLLTKKIAPPPSRAWLRVIFVPALVALIVLSLAFGFVYAAAVFAAMLVALFVLMLWRWGANRSIEARERKYHGVSSLKRRH